MSPPCAAAGPWRTSTGCWGRSRGGGDRGRRNTKILLVARAAPLSQRTPGEVDVAVEPIELRDDDWTCQPADHLESRGKLRPALKRVSALASLDFGESIYDVAALGSGKPDEGSTLNQVPDTKGCATGCRFRCRNLITIKCADCRICSALWVELLQRYFSRILTGDRAFLAGVMCRDESRYRSV